MPDKTAKLVRAYPPAVYGNAGTTISLLYKSDANYAVLSNIGSADAGLCGWRMIFQSTLPVRGATATEPVSDSDT